MNILAIETSCDETAIAIIKSNKSGTKCTVLAHTVLTQIDIHKEYGGVFPALAKREHARVMVTLLEKTLTDAKFLKKNKKNIPLSKKVIGSLGTILAREEVVREELITFFENNTITKIDAIAVTSGPGLEPALWVGINTALALGTILKLPVYPINHMEGHILSSILKESRDPLGRTVQIVSPVIYPALAVLISGGHTELVLVHSNAKYKIVGQTKDDAIGEAFDKVARMLGLSYPGGPEISKLAKIAREKNVVLKDEDKLPRPMLHSKDLDFSFSGLKTAVLYKIKKYTKLKQSEKEHIALDFENAVTEILIKKITKAIEQYGVKNIIVGGGVSANTHIRQEISKSFSSSQDVYIPDRHLSTDNALMIAVTAMTHIKNGVKPKKKIVANGNWHL